MHGRTSSILSIASATKDVWNLSLLLFSSLIASSLGFRSGVSEICYQLCKQAFDLTVLPLLLATDYVLGFTMILYGNMYQCGLCLLYMGMAVFCVLTGMTRHLEKTEEMVERLEQELREKNKKDTSNYESSGLYCSVLQESGYITDSTEVSDESELSVDLEDQDHEEVDDDLDASHCSVDLQLPEYINLELLAVDRSEQKAGQENLVCSYDFNANITDTSRANRGVNSKEADDVRLVMTESSKQLLSSSNETVISKGRSCHYY